MLLRMGLSPNEQREGATPLVMAALYGCLSTTVLLVQQRADVNAGMLAGHTLLLIVAASRAAPVARASPCKGSRRRPSGVQS